MIFLHIHSTEKSSNTHFDSLVVECPFFAASYLLERGIRHQRTSSVLDHVGTMAMESLHFTCGYLTLPHSRRHHCCLLLHHRDRHLAKRKESNSSPCHIFDNYDGVWHNNNCIRLVNMFNLIHLLMEITTNGLLLIPTRLSLLTIYFLSMQDQSLQHELRSLVPMRLNLGEPHLEESFQEPRLGALK